jgi:glycosyltransferase involved in cell wall biosynthesis
MAGSNLTILVSGMVAANPHHGGASWAVLQYVLGLRRLGHDVHVVEPVAARSVQPEGTPLARSANARYFRRVMEDFGLKRASVLLLEGTNETIGASYDELRALARRAEVLININGVLAEPDLVKAIPTRIYLDIDAGFNQLWHALRGIDRRFAGHTHHVTIGHGIGAPWCSVPTCGINWIKSVQPVVLEHWPVAGEIIHDALTTVGNWRADGSFEHNGVFYGQKAHSLRRLITLPTRTSERFLLALAIHPDEKKDLEALSRNHWRLVDPAQVAATPEDYRRFIQGSKAELGLVKHGCLAAPCGWFSDRSVCYLASGRPVVAQETGFSRLLPTGEGLFAFETEEGALQAIEALNHDYPRHARAARALAEQHFDSDKVLSRLLARVGIA